MSRHSLPAAGVTTPLFCVSGLVILFTAAPGWADWTDARCVIYPPASDHAELTVPCTFGQRQGAVTITREDGVSYELVPDGESPGVYRDGTGRPAYRESGLGAAGTVFRLEDQTVYVYWLTTADKAVPQPDNPTAPYSTADYDATTLLPCGPTPAVEARCPAGILRMENHQASIVVTNPAGAEFTFNFMTDYVNATNRTVDARLEGDTWKVVVNGNEYYEVPQAAIEGD